MVDGMVTAVSQEDRHGLEEALKEAQRVLAEGIEGQRAINFSPNHYLMMKVKSHIISLYGSLAAVETAGMN